MSTQFDLLDDYIFLSDLHLADGQNPISKNWGRYEQFFFDHVFSSFLDHLTADAHRLNRRVHLILLGDTFDFIHTRASSSSAQPDSSFTESEALSRLEKIHTGHAQFFEALGRFVSTGQKISILPGNHDAALVWISVQERLAELIQARSNPGSPDPPFTYHPWYFYLPGFFYAEHGQQYHDINAFTTLLAPFLSDRSDEIELTLGACLDESLLELISQLPQELNLRGSMISSLLRAYLKHPSIMLTSRSIQWKSIRTILRLLKERSSTDTVSRRRFYRNEILPGFAQRTQLSASTVQALDRLSEVSNLKLLQRILITGFKQGHASSRDHYLYRAAEEIASLLGKTGQNVPYYVFGHSHLSQRIPISEDPGSRSVFLNTGSWSVPPFTSPELAKEKVDFPYVRIRQESDETDPQARLLFWKTPCQ